MLPELRQYFSVQSNDFVFQPSRISTDAMKSGTTN